MALISVNVPDEVVPRVLDAFAATFGYSTTNADGSPNTQTKAQFAKAQLANWVRGIVVSHEAAKAADAARVSADQKANAEVTVT